MSVTLYGTSDDLIEIEGDIREEFGVYGDDENYVGFSDGTVARIAYNDDGCWEIRVVVTGASAHEHTPHDNDETTYTDRLTLTGDITWAVIGKVARAAKKKEQTSE